MAVNDKLKLVTEGTLYGVSCFNVFNYVETGASASFSSERALVDTFITNILPTWMQAVGDAFTMHCISAEKLGAGPSAPYSKALVAGNVGTAGDPSLPANRVMAVTLYSAPGIAAAIGRKSFSAIPSDEESDNALTATQFSLLEALGLSLVGNMAGAGGFAADHVIRSADLILDSAIIAVTSHPQVRTLRGRTPRLC